MTLYGVDLSNHNLGPATYRGQQWYQEAQFVIAQAIDPPPSYPPGVTAEQLRAAKADGKYIGAYVWLWNSGDFESDIRHKLSTIPADVSLDMRLWLDVEDTGSSFDQQRCLRALEICDKWATAKNLPPTGVYTGQWYINGYMGGWFPPDRMYWMADYSRPPELFPSRPLHQYTSNPVDKNAMLESEIVTQGGNVTDEERQQYEDKIDGLVVTVADIADRLGDQLVAESHRGYVRKTVIRNIVKQMQAERVQAVGERPG